MTSVQLMTTVIEWGNSKDKDLRFMSNQGPVVSQNQCKEFQLFKC